MNAEQLGTLLREEVVIVAAFKIPDGKSKKGNVPKLWDGKTAKKLVEVVMAKAKCESEFASCPHPKSM